jgi:hypothetical protein
MFPPRLGLIRPMSAAPSSDLSDGSSIPQLGFGVLQIPPEATTDAIRAALEVGCGGLSHTRASLTIARKLARRCYRTPPGEPGPEALAEPS